MLTPHTPGPWHDDGYRIHAPTMHEDKRNGRLIVEYKHVEDFNPADGPLIAAAPELLEACKQLVGAMIQLDKEHHWEVAFAQAVIEKADVQFDLPT